MTTDQNSASLASLQHATLENTFNFRQIKPSDMNSLLNEFEEASRPVIADLFDELTETHGEGDNAVTKVVGYRRKPVTVKVQVPQLPDGVPAIMQTWVNQNVLAFVKSQYVDNFTEVGQHDIDYIAHKAALSGGRTGGISIEKEVLEAAAASLGKYIASVTGNMALGKKVEIVAKERFSKSSITRNIGAFSDELLSRLAERVTQWAEHVATSPEEADNVEDYTSAYQFWEAKISAHAQVPVVNYASIL